MVNFAFEGRHYGGGRAACEMGVWLTEQQHQEKVGGGGTVAEVTDEYGLYIKTQSVPRSKHSVFVIKTSKLMLYREIIAVCSQIHTKHINTLCGQNVELLNVKLAVYPLSYRVPVRERYGSTLLPATREQHDQNCTQSH